MEGMQRRYLGEHASNGSAPVWKFLTAVTVGQLAGFGAAALARGSMRKEACSTREAMEVFAGVAGFWLVGGLSWVLLTKRRA